MLIDPKRRKFRQIQPRFPTLAEVQGLLLELSPLAGLSWTPLQLRMSCYAAALAGQEGITQTELVQLRVWAARWHGLLPEVRQFYRAEAPAPWVDAALWTLLAEDRPLSGALLGRVHEAWIARYGAPPSCTLSRSLR